MFVSVFRKFAQQLVEKTLEPMFLKIVTKNVRKELVLKLMIRGWIYFSADF